MKSLNKIGMLSKYPDFWQLSTIEKFERFDENSAEKNPIQTPGWDKSISPCQIGICGFVFTRGIPRPLFIKSRVLLVTNTEETEKV